MKKFDVTQDLINKGQKNTGTLCPVALAIREEYPTVYVQHGIIFLEPTSCTKEYYCSYRLKKWLVDFDKNVKVEPFTLYLNDDSKVAMCIQNDIATQS